VASRADTDVMTTAGAFLVPWAMVWVVLLRTLLAAAGIVPKICTRCGLALERRVPGETVCRCC
jgi:hypothetical protein